SEHFYGYIHMQYPRTDFRHGSPGRRWTTYYARGSPYVYFMDAFMRFHNRKNYYLAPEVPPFRLDYIPGPEGPPSPDYVPDPEEPEQAPPRTSGEKQPFAFAAPHSTAESQADYPADRDDNDEEEEEEPSGDDADDEDEDEDEDKEEEEEHPAPNDSPVHRMTGRISIRDEPSISLPPREEIPSPTPNSPTHIEIPESCLPLRKRVRFASPTPSREVGESSAVGAARQDRPTIAREDLYGFVDMVDVPPRCSTSRELDYDITDTWDDLEETTSMYGIMEDAQDDGLYKGRVNLVLYRDRPFHHRLAIMIERERLRWLVMLGDYPWMLVTMHGEGALHSYWHQTTRAGSVDIRPLSCWKGTTNTDGRVTEKHGPAEGPSQPDAPGEAFVRSS
ncbi:hypothetical protein Tco_0722198, partial [Tanacetum coccineum]